LIVGGHPGLGTPRKKNQGAESGTSVDNDIAYQGEVFLGRDVVCNSFRLPAVHTTAQMNWLGI
jgi:hypothetical protein